jgi:hypothetical protein
MPLSNEHVLLPFKLVGNGDVAIVWKLNAVYFFGFHWLVLAFDQVVMQAP